MGHELSKRLDESEKLDEFWLRAIAGMYAQKRRQKQFHDHHILTKEFRLGDLVLVFTLKEFEAKFTKQGRGPYVIANLSSSGAIKLSTLEGEEMSNSISGCRIKKYNKPLTQHELNLLHQAKWQKEWKQIEIELAREEAKLRAQKQKLVWEVREPMRIYKMELLRGEEELEEDTPQPIITI